MIKDYLDLLEKPPEEARGCTRWWWYGGAVTREGIKKQLEHMKDACIGSVELQVLYPLEMDNTELGIKNIPYFSPEFFDLLEYTVETAEKMRMEVDFTLGSSWPYGGPFITHEMSAQQALLTQIDLYGPCRFDYDFTSRITGRIVRVVMGRMEQGRMVEESILDLTERLETRYLYGWEYGKYIENVDIPAGNWKVIVLYIQKYRQLTGIPAPNMAGYAMDHCRKDVSDYFFWNAGSPIIKKLGKSRIRSFFCDSIELEGHNWTEALMEEFRKRRGYDLTPHIYALWGEVGELTPEIRYDYYKTMSELTLENFFYPFADWCRANGSHSRIQAHGTWGDILKAYAAADIPEGETFGEGDRLEVNTVHRKLASSAAHVYGKPIVSNESFTWLRVPRYMETLEQMKAAVDAIFLDGMNMIVNHGYAYTPESIEAPGWAFYASSHICHLNTWWPYYRELGQYIQRVCAFLRRGRNVAEVAVYLPQADIWSSNPIGDLHIAMKLDEYMGREMVNHLSRNGYFFDFINDEAVTLPENICREGLTINRNTYRVIILPEVHRLPPDTARRLKEFVEQGGSLVAACCIPEKGCGYSPGSRDRQVVKNLMGEIFGGEKDQWQEVGKGRTIFTSGKTTGITGALNRILTPDLHIEQGNGSIGYIHRVDGSTDIYFVSNVSEKGCRALLDFKNTGMGCMVLDPLSGKIITPGEIRYSGKTGRTELSIEFEPFQSFLVLFGGDIPQKEYKRDEKPQNLRLLDISAGWHFSMPAEKFETEMDFALTWEQIPCLRYCTGEGIYSKTVTVDREMLESSEVFLSFEKVGETAEIWVNGKKAGVLWKAPREMDIRPFLREGANALVVKVVNLWINDAIKPDRMEAGESRAVAEEWPYFTETIRQIRKKRLYPQKERELVKQPLPSGIGGKVKLKYSCRKDEEATEQ